MPSEKLRPFQLADVVDVAQLWQTVFRGNQTKPSDAVAQTFRDVFLSGPLADPECPSLVRFDATGKIIGFVGVLSRRLTFGDRTLRAVVPCQIMVDRSVSGAGFMVFEMLSRLRSYPSDLIFNDGANDEIESPFCRIGGLGICYYSLEWICPVRRLEHAVAKFERHPKYRVLSKLAPLLRLLDRTVMPLIVSRNDRGPDLDVTTHEASAAEYLDCLQVTRHGSLLPIYDLTLVEWLFARAREARRLGSLRVRVVRRQDRIIGGFCYYVRSGGVAQMLHLGATSRPAAHAVFRAALDDSAAQGAVALSGQPNERFRKAIFDHGGQFKFPGFGVLASAKDREVIAALQRGDGSLSRLDGEWWLRLGIDRLTDW